MSDSFHTFAIITLIIGLIGLFDVFILPDIKANAMVTEETLSQQEDPYLSSLDEY